MHFELRIVAILTKKDNDGHKMGPRWAKGWSTEAKRGPRWSGVPQDLKEYPKI